MRKYASAAVAVFAGLVLASGCERPTTGITMTTPSPRPLRLEVPTPGYRLDAATRAKVPPGIDADALERLLAHIVPEERPRILAYFQLPVDPKLGFLTGFHDPKLQEILEEVWAPMWDFEHATDEQIRNRDYSFPGAEIALARRQAARAAAKRAEPGP